MFKRLLTCGCALGGGKSPTLIMLYMNCRVYSHFPYMCPERKVAGTCSVILFNYIFLHVYFKSRRIWDLIIGTFVKKKSNASLHNSKSPEVNKTFWKKQDQSTRFLLALIMIDVQPIILIGQRQS